MSERVTKTGVVEIEALLRRGENEEALRRLEGMARRSVRARQLYGLALARTGRTVTAQRVFAELHAGGHADEETLGIYARTYMDRYDRTGVEEYLRRSRDLYAEAFGRWPESYYLGINAAAKSVLLGDVEAAEGHLQRVAALVGEDAVPGDYWRTATVAEVALMRGDAEKAGERYREAVLLAPLDLGSHRSTWQQAKRLLQALGATAGERAAVARAFRHLTDAAPAPAVTHPPVRRLRVFAFDPGASRRLQTVGVNEVTLRIPWEVKEDGTSALERGPVGEYLEVVDHDPASGCFYEAVDLDDPKLLATDGLAPSEGDPRFHQQMVFAVAMNVIEHFERALGRRALWATRQVEVDGALRSEFVRRLRIYPHALRDANAYYSPDKKALLFGYFPAEVEDATIAPGSMVFTCLSHDVIAHEMSHALLDGLHPRFAEATNRDVLAFHEAFADLVALFQHFSHPAVLEHEIARTRADLASQNMLGQLAQEFGRSIGRHGALRDAIGEIDPETKEWRKSEPDPVALATADEPHARGAILVAAVFDAFLAIYRGRVADLLRIATQGSGVLPAGALHPDLVRRLAREAAKSADHVLRICIRALDYCPPVDLTFGDYLRALVTADVDAMPDDRLHYRLAFIESFQRRGIHPDDVRNLSEESLVWRPPREQQGMDLTALFEHGGLEPEWRPTGDREGLWKRMRENARVVHRWLRTSCSAQTAEEIGLCTSASAPKGLFSRRSRPAVEVHSVRLARRSTPVGETRTDFVIEILQRRRGYFDPDTQRRVDESGPAEDDHGDFRFRGGCTLLVDPETCRIRYAVNKHILSSRRLERQRAFLGRGGRTLRATYFGDPGRGTAAREPFAMLHRSVDVREQTS